MQYSIISYAAYWNKANDVISNGGEAEVGIDISVIFGDSRHFEQIATKLLALSKNARMA